MWCCDSRIFFNRITSVWSEWRVHRVCSSTTDWHNSFFYSYFPHKNNLLSFRLEALPTMCLRDDFTPKDQHHYPLRGWYFSYLQAPFLLVPTVYFADHILAAYKSVANTFSPSQIAHVRWYEDIKPAAVRRINDWMCSICLEDSMWRDKYWRLHSYNSQSINWEKQSIIEMRKMGIHLSFSLKWVIFYLPRASVGVGGIRRSTAVMISYRIPSRIKSYTTSNWC